MALANELRRKAALLRRAAKMPTQGGKSADRALVILAERLEQQADLADQVDKAASNRRVAPVPERF